ncbi:glutathione S-transferase 1-like [Oppia nitens]|uniref:glutathione S-transferase 1-like n=1 Tax=Oppia nitens TaxID=1686743 RepID=UPI0023DB4B87|nr:glutathione S-transferase 1-like [Oppia nitens]
MPIDLYYMPESPPSRSVLMVAKHLDVKVNIKPLDILKGEHLEPDFIELNPSHTIPTIVDEDLVLWESRAIITYLCNQYGPDSPLYPQNTEERAIVDKWLQFDLGTLYKSILDYTSPMFEGSIKLDKQKEQTMCSALELLDNQLSQNRYVCGSKLTLADISIIQGIDLLTEVMEYDITNHRDYKFVAGWQARLRRRDLPYYREVCEDGNENLRNFVRSQIHGSNTNPAAK